jgi:hypothetical protein
MTAQEVATHAQLGVGWDGNFSSSMTDLMESPEAAHKFRKVEGTGPQQLAKSVGTHRALCGDADMQRADDCFVRCEKRIRPLLVGSVLSFGALMLALEGLLLDFACGASALAGGAGGAPAAATMVPLSSLPLCLQESLLRAPALRVLPAPSSSAAGGHSAKAGKGSPGPAGSGGADPAALAGAGGARRPEGPRAQSAAAGGGGPSQARAVLAPREAAAAAAIARAEKTQRQQQGGAGLEPEPEPEPEPEAVREQQAATALQPPQAPKEQLPEPAQPRQELKLVFKSEGGRDAAFYRLLTHGICQFYALKCVSATEAGSKKKTKERVMRITSPKKAMDRASAISMVGYLQAVQRSKA